MASKQIHHLAAGCTRFAAAAVPHRSAVHQSIPGFVGHSCCSPEAGTAVQVGFQRNRSGSKVRRCCIELAHDPQASGQEPIRCHDMGSGLRDGDDER